MYGLDIAVLLNSNYKHICLFGQILTGQTGQPYSNISPYEVSECSLVYLSKEQRNKKLTVVYFI